MKKVVSLFAVLCFSLIASLPAHSQDLNQLLQGSEIRLLLQNNVTSAIAHQGDPFIATVEEPVYVDKQLVLPAGTKITGMVGAVIRPRFFSIFRGQAAMNLTFRSIHIGDREVPVQMSIIAIQSRQKEGYYKRRGDIKVDEGQILQEKHDIKGDAFAVALGTGGGSVVGAVFSNALRGFGIGLAGSAIYVVARKGKEVDLPAQTGLLCRLDSTLMLPTAAATSTAASTAGTN
jgi:hypothetical protein